MSDTAAGPSAASGVPPDPGGRSRYLIRAIAVACIVLGLIAVVLLFALREATPPSTPQQQPDKGQIALPIGNRLIATTAC